MLILSAQKYGFSPRRPTFSPVFSIALRYEAKREVFHKGELKGEIKELFLSTCEALSAISAISSTSEAAKPMTVGLLLYHATGFSTKEYFCPAEIKEIKEILLPSLCEAISAISVISVGLLLYHAAGFSTKEYFCPTERTERTEIPLPPANPFLLFLPFLWDIIISCG